MDQTNDETEDVVICPLCLGEGVIADPLSQGLVDTMCPECDGEGVIWYEV